MFLLIIFSFDTLAGIVGRIRFTECFGLNLEQPLNSMMGGLRQVERLDVHRHGYLRIVIWLLTGSSSKAVMWYAVAGAAGDAVAVACAVGAFVPLAALISLWLCLPLAPNIRKLGLPLALHWWRRGVASLRVLLVGIASAAATAAVEFVAFADA